MKFCYLILKYGFNEKIDSPIDAFLIFGRISNADFGFKVKPINTKKNGAKSEKPMSRR